MCIRDRLFSGQPVRAFQPAVTAISIEDAVDLGKERCLGKPKAPHQRIAIGERVLTPAFHAGTVSRRERRHLVAEEQLGIAAAPDLSLIHI